MSERNCDTCTAWQYGHSIFSEPEGTRMFGYCTIQQRETRQGFFCGNYRDRRQQEREYLARIAAAPSGAGDEGSKIRKEKP
jgi:hypothetical protein